MRVLLAIAASLLLSACGTVYRQAADEFLRTQPESAWGARPPDGHEKVEADWIRKQLKDPYTADIRHAGIARYVVPASMTDPTVVPVWGSRLDVNAKNSYGGYTGFKSYLFMYSKGTLFAIENPEGSKQWVNQPSQ